MALTSRWPWGSAASKSERRLPRLWTGSSVARSDVAPVEPVSLESLIDVLTERWRRGERARAEEYLDRLTDPEDRLELIYQEFCLAHAAGDDAGAAEAAILARFPAQADRLRRIIRVGLLLPKEPAEQPGWADQMLVPGDEVGPYRLLRILGQGAIGRVFLAEEMDLEDRLVVLKASARPSAEHRLLARAPHPNIVPVLRHAPIRFRPQEEQEAEEAPDRPKSEEPWAHGEIEAFYLIAMPFLGGASLNDVIKRLFQAGRPRTGRDWLVALDAVSAPEYGEPSDRSPGRATLEGLSHHRAAAWIVARLAEALDHAFRRGVTHGDLKPSNILLTAEGQPTLLDFNLADAWRDDLGESTSLTGGTLAYASPERLRRLAEDPEKTPAPRPIDRHRADLYALGLVLREMLTGLAPGVAGASRSSTSRGRAAGLADERATERYHFPGVPAGLRAILDRCLTLTPSHRYDRGTDLARALDGWIEDRAIEDAGWSTRLVGSLKRHSSLITLTSIACLTAFTVLYISYELQSRRREQERFARNLYSSILRESGVLGFHRLGKFNTARKADPGVTAHSVLVDFNNVLEDDSWWDDGRLTLPLDDRDDAELLVVENAWRYTTALLSRRDRQADREGLNALSGLEKIARRRPVGPLLSSYEDLYRKVKSASPTTLSGEVPLWMSEYFEGLVLEKRPDLALVHFENASRLRRSRSSTGEERIVDLFWAHYRASQANARLGRYEEAIGHLNYCIQHQPTQPALHTQKGGLLFLLGRREEAAIACFTALDQDLSFAEAHRTLAYIEKGLQLPHDLNERLEAYRRLTREHGLLEAIELELELRLETSSDRENSLDPKAAIIGRRILAAYPENIEVRFILTNQLLRLGEHDAAIKGYDQLLEVCPDHLGARLNKGLCLHHLGKKAEAIKEFEYLIGNPLFSEQVVKAPEMVGAFNSVTWSLILKNEDNSAEIIGRCGLAWSLSLLSSRLNDDPKYRQTLAECYFVLARSLAMKPQIDSQERLEISVLLGQAIAIESDILMRRFARDKCFANDFSWLCPLEPSQLR